jgi:hypothetical protein
MKKIHKAERQLTNSKAKNLQYTAQQRTNIPNIVTGKNP